MAYLCYIAVRKKKVAKSRKKLRKTVDKQPKGCYNADTMEASKKNKELKK